MQPAELTRFRELLDEQRDVLRTKLQDMGADPDAETVELEFDFGFADGAQSTAERNKVLAEIERLREHLRDVEIALRKVERGDYGVCERCGQPISPERLEAILYARLCVSCKQKEAG